MADPRYEYAQLMTRRSFFRASGTGLGFAALATLLREDLGAVQAGSEAFGGLPDLPHFAPKAKRVIYLCMSGAPSHLDLFDYKPGLQQMAGEELPDSVRKRLRLSTMTATQNTLPIIPTVFEFAQHGQSGAWLSELLPYTARIADSLCFVKSLWNSQLQSRPRPDSPLHRLPAHGSAHHRRMGLLRAGQREPQPARLRGDADHRFEHVVTFIIRSDCYCATTRIVAGKTHECQPRRAETGRRSGPTAHDGAVYLGLRVETDVRRATVEGIVDTGAVSLVIPEEIATELGLRHWGTRTAVYADERREERPVTDVTIEIGNLTTRTEAIVGPAGSQVLIGQVVLETLDLIADCRNRTLAPRHP